MDASSNVTILDRDVIQANPLIRARKMMNLTEMRLFILGLQNINPHIREDHFHDIEFHETVITHSELAELFGTDNNGNIANLKHQVDKAYDGKIELSYKDGGFGFRHIYRKMDYKPQEGLTIQFDDEIKPYILDLVNKAYTRYKVKALFSLSSTYAWRILESLLEKQGYLKQGYKEIFLVLTIEDVRFRLNVPDGKYADRINNFRKYVLDLPIKEINEKTDYVVWYEVQKRGRKVTGFKFWLKLKNASESTEEPPSIPSNQAISKDELAKEMLAEGMPKSAINTWVKRYGVEGAAASWRLAVEHANGRNETRHEGEQRYKYIKSCMERNISQMNEDDARTKTEIDAREKRLAEEKKRHQKEDLEALGKLGFSVERRGSDMQSAGSLLGSDADNPPRRSLDEIVKEKPWLAGVASRVGRVEKRASPEAQESEKTVEEQLEEQGQQRLFDVENDIFGNDESKKIFENKFKKIVKSDCSSDEKIDKILKLEGDDESGNLLKMLSLMLEKFGTLNEYGHREMKLQ